MIWAANSREKPAPFPFWWQELLEYCREFHCEPTAAARAIDEDATWFVRWRSERLATAQVKAND